MLSNTPAERPDVEEIAKYLEDFLLRNSTALEQKSVWGTTGCSCLARPKSLETFVQYINYIEQL